MNEWLGDAARILGRGESLVRVTVVAARGSVPRDTGTCMLVGAAAQWGTIGGGHLEWDAIRIARELIGEPAGAGCGAGLPSRRNRYSLGASLGQCCGGAVELAFERLGPEDLDFVRAGLALLKAGQPTVLACLWQAGFCCLRTWITDEASRSACVARLPAGFSGAAEAIAALGAASAEDPRHRLLSALAGRPGQAVEPAARAELWLERADLPRAPLWIFGAGHVAHALVPILLPLPFSIHWIDTREEALAGCAVPTSELRLTHSDDPVGELTTAPHDALYLVMTHSHDLDYAICQRILERGVFRELGVIGSETKARRFRQRLGAHGIEPGLLARMTSPIGIDGIDSKLPAAIAVAVAAQLLQWLVPSAQAPVPALSHPAPNRKVNA